MSSDSEVQSISEWWTDIQFTNCLVATGAILFYDLLLTYDREVSTIWRRKLSAVSVLFVTIRYVTLLSQVVYFANALMPGILPICVGTIDLFYAANVVGQIACVVFGFLRIWAIWGRPWLLWVIILPIGLFPAAIDIYQLPAEQNFTIQQLTPMQGGCSGSTNISDSILNPLAITSRSCAIIYETVIIVGTWIKTWQGLKSRNIHIGHSGVHLSKLIIRDGTSYYIVLTCLHVAAAILDATPQVTLNPLSPMIDSFNAILLCRFILNLRTYDLPNESTLPANATQVSSVRFMSAIIDNIGASISISGEEYPEALDDDSQNRMSATLDEIINSPLTIGLEDDIRRMKRTGTSGGGTRHPRGLTENVDLQPSSEMA